MAKIYNVQLLNRIELEIKKILKKELKWFSEKSIYNITYSDNPLNFQRKITREKKQFLFQFAAES